MTTDYLWDEFSRFGDVVLETGVNPDTTLYRTMDYVLAGGMLVTQTDESNLTQYFLSDVQGSTRILANSDGSVAAEFSYDAFGNVNETINPTDPDTTYLYTGQQFDPYTELYSLRARYYDSLNGRFLSRDTWEYNYQNPLELNRYVYTANNPVTYIDPSGYSLASVAKMIQSFLVVRGPTMIVGGIVGASFGAIAGGLHAAATYAATSFDWCGSRTNESSRASAIKAGIISGAIFGGAVGVGAGAGPIGKIVTGAILTVAGFGGLVGSGYELSVDLLQGEGFNACAFGDGVLSTMTMFFGLNMVANGVAQAVAEALTRPITQGTAVFRPQILWNSARDRHIFRNSRGHVGDNPSQGKAWWIAEWIRVASNSNNYRQPSPSGDIQGLISSHATNAGVRAYTETTSLGQVWVHIRSGEITNAGLNLLGQFK